VTPRLKIPPQITRLIGLTILIVAGYFTARHFLVPASFGQYGWYRGDALKDYAALPINYGGQASCVDCHEEVVKKLAKAKHQVISCEACHGPGATHAGDPTILPAKVGSDSFCLRCHEAAPARPEKFKQVVVADHFAGQQCAECHQAHFPTEAP
jgi:hypothetical protein